jgi:hypothetical protein
LSFDSDLFWKKSLAIDDENSFNECALELFRHQSEKVEVYKQFLGLLKRVPSTVTHYSQIPFLPVSLFKNNVISDQPTEPDFFFTSSGTTGQITSKHYLVNTKIYDESLVKCFTHFYGDPGKYCFLALLPSYLERSGSSLVYMMEHLIQHGGHPLSGFFLYNDDELAERMQILIQNNEKIFLLGVTYALLDFFHKYPMSLSNVIVMETGGMKGRRKELVKSEVHQLLSAATGLKNIHSEYGMTELLSQSYSTGEGIFSCPPWMKIIISDLHDHFSLASENETGIIKVIDLANIHSCAFIETQDLGRIQGDNKFEVLGRMDNSELRGCNLLVG